MLISGYVIDGKMLSQLTSPLYYLEYVFTAALSAGSLLIVVSFWRRRSSFCSCVSQIQQLEATPPKHFVQVLAFLCVAGAVGIINICNFTSAYVRMTLLENLPQWLVVLYGVSVSHSTAVLTLPFVAYIVYTKIIYHQFAKISNVLEEFLSSDRFLQVPGQGARQATDGDIDLNDIYTSYAKLRLLYEELWRAMFLQVLAINIFVLVFCVAAVYDLIHISTGNVDPKTVIVLIVVLILIFAIYCQGHVADMVSKEVSKRNI